MLQYPVNIYPDGNTFDAMLNNSDNQIRFTFNGDIYSGALYRVYNYDTGEMVKEGVLSFEQSLPHAPKGFNGDEIVSSTGIFGYEGNSPLANGTNYVMQLQLFQWTQDGTAPLYDMFVLRGNVQDDYDPTAVKEDEYGNSYGYVTIKPDIPNIYEWDTFNDDVTKYPSSAWGALAGSMMIVVNGEKRVIQGYRNADGSILIDIDSPFTNPIPKGTKYQIYSNYVVTKPCYFQCRSTPAVGLTLSFVDDTGIVGDHGIKFHVEGTYSQAEGSLINYYRVKLQWNWDLQLVPWRDLDATEKIYSQNIECDFFDDFILKYKRIVHGDVQEISATELGNIAYKAVVEVITADGKTITASSTPIVDYEDTTDIPETYIQEIVPLNSEVPDVYYPDSVDAEIQLRTQNLKHIVRIIGGIDSGEPLPPNTKRTYYRENLDTGEIRLLEGVIDATVPTRGHFKYYEILRRVYLGSAYRYVKGISSKEITLDGSQMNGCSITELLPYDDAYQWGTRTRYYLGDQWKFVGEIQDTTITQNMDKYAHVGYGTYPQITSTKTCYLSGTVSAMNGYVDCTTKKYTDTIDLVRAWRQFVSRQAIYMLKTQKGDVLVVGIVDNPTTTYSENIKEIPTTFSFNWVELADINDIKVDFKSSRHPDQPI